MEFSTEIRHGRHCVFNLHVHLVFVTKYRKKIFSKTHIEAMRKIFGKVCADFDAERDHVHLLVNYPPKVSVSNMVNSLKGVSSRLLRKNFPEITKYFWKGVLWSPSYFAASCGGAPISVLREYID
jgi:putative transposase